MTKVIKITTEQYNRYIFEGIDYKKQGTRKGLRSPYEGAYIAHMCKDKDMDKDIKGVWGKNHFRDFTKKYKPIRLEANNKYPYLPQTLNVSQYYPLGGTLY